MPIEYLPILLFLAIAVAIPLIGLILAWVLRPSVPGGKFKRLPYECGIDPEGDVRRRYTIRFFIIAILFVVFDVEVVFLFPWAVVYHQLLLFGFIEMGIFLAILIIGYIYVWKKGALEWV